MNDPRLVLNRNVRISISVIDFLESVFADPALFGCVTLERLLNLFAPRILHEIVVMINEYA